MSKTFLPFAENPLSTSGDYVFHLAPISQGLVASMSNNAVHLLAYDPLTFKTSSSLRVIEGAHSAGSSITGLKAVDANTVVSTSDAGEIRLWDFRMSNSSRPQVEFRVLPPQNFGKKNDKPMPILSVDALAQRVAVGTELVGVDAGVHIFDLRGGSSEPAVSYVDSHNDDVTEIKFHPTDVNALLSGSTDGLVNVYNTTIADEDEAVYQTINHGASIHSTGFLAEKRLYALSHMETLSVYQVADPDANVPEPAPVEFGDVREPWGCEYVIDVCPGYVAVGSHPEEDQASQNFSLIPFLNETPDLANRLVFQGGHGEEVVRSLYIDDRSQVVYSGGEDGIVKVWKADGLDCSKSYFSATPWRTEDAMEVDNNVDDNAIEEKTEKKEKKDKKHKKDKKEKRFKPY
jgi:WD40 repeat protein